jgi:iron complex transport system permease protein
MSIAPSRHGVAMRRQTLLWCAALLVLLAGCTLLSIATGAVRIPIDHVWGVLWSKLGIANASGAWTPGERNIVWELRMPRAILAAAAGASLAAVGTVLQVLTRNPLADPYLFGISSGATVGAVSVIVYGGATVGILALPSAAFLGALLAMLLVFNAARTREGTTGERLILTGVAVAFVLQGLTNFLIFNSLDRGADAAIFWMLGGFSNARWHLVPLPVTVSVIGIAWLMLRAPRVNAMVLGDEAARAVGVDAARLRLELFVVTAVMTGATVAASGSIGFVGLILPHVMRRFVGGDLRRLLPVTALAGSVFLVAADVAARTIWAPREVPLGVVTAVIGGLVFLGLTRRQR